MLKKSIYSQLNARRTKTLCSLWKKIGCHQQTFSKGQQVAKCPVEKRNSIECAIKTHFIEVVVETEKGVIKFMFVFSLSN